MDRLTLRLRPPPAARQAALGASSGFGEGGLGGFGRGGGLGDQELGQGRYGGAFEDGDLGDVDPQLSLQARDDPDGGQGVASEVEEVVVDADGLDPQELLPDGGDLLLAVRSEERRVGKECRWRWRR